MYPLPQDGPLPTIRNCDRADARLPDAAPTARIDVRNVTAKARPPMTYPANRAPIDPKVVQRALDIVASLPFVTAATPSRTIEEFAAVFADFARKTPLAQVATLQGYRPEIMCNLIGAMVEWRRCELDNQMAALGAEEVSAHAQLAQHFVFDPLPSQPVTDGPATRRLHRLFGSYLRAMKPRRH
jgi:hypothetical protein